MSIYLLQVQVVSVQIMTAIKLMFAFGSVIMKESCQS